MAMCAAWMRIYFRALVHMHCRQLVTDPVKFLIAQLDFLGSTKYCRHAFHHVHLYMAMDEKVALQLIFPAFLSVLGVLFIFTTAVMGVKGA
jgi:hypothetical protein